MNRYVLTVVVEGLDTQVDIGTQMDFDTFDAIRFAANTDTFVSLKKISGAVVRDNIEIARAFRFLDLVESNV